VRRLVCTRCRPQKIGFSGNPISSPPIALRPASIRSSATELAPSQDADGKGRKLAGLPPRTRWLAQNIPKARAQSGQANDHDADSDPHRPGHGRPPFPANHARINQTDSGMPSFPFIVLPSRPGQKKPALATDPERDLRSESATPKLTEEGKGSRQPATGPQSYRGGPQGRCEPVPTTQFVQGCFVKAVSNCAPLALTEAERRPAGFRRAHIWQAASGRARV
jgi:hypothetical protein